MKCLQVVKERSYLVIQVYFVMKSKVVEIVKEVKRSDSLWRFACGDVYQFHCLTNVGAYPPHYTKHVTSNFVKMSVHSLYQFPGFPTSSEGVSYLSGQQT